MKKKKRQNGFTLVELLIVIAIIGILVALGLVSLQGARRSARDAKRKADLEEVRAVLEMCRADTGGYPLVQLGSGSPITCGGETYMRIPTDPGGRNYYYHDLGTNDYYLCAALEGDSPSPAVNCGPECVETCNFELNAP